MMKTILSYIRALISFLLPLAPCSLLLAPSPCEARNFYGYTEENPLVIVIDWDFQPFEFMDSEGRPSGYNTEVLDLILNRLEIPHRFVLQEWHVATGMFERHEADLIHALSFIYKGRPYIQTQKYINYYPVKVARHISVPPLVSIDELSRKDTLMLKKNDYVALRVQALGDSSCVVSYATPKDALSVIQHRRKGYFVWGEMPLQRKIQELNLDSVVLDNIDIPAGELRIIGYDKELIDIIDDQYTRLEESGDLQAIEDKWFHPERQHDDASPGAIIILVVLLVVGGVVFLLSRLMHIRVKKAVDRLSVLNNMMLQALNMGDYAVLQYDIKTRRVINRHGHLLPDEGMTIDELIDRCPPEQREEFHQLVDKMTHGEIDQWDLQHRWNVGTDEQPDWHEFYGNAIIEYKHGERRYIIHTVKDITREKAEERHNRELAERYLKLFDSNLMAMSIYDSKGRLINLNQKMRVLCKFDADGERYFRDINLFDLQGVKDDIDPHSVEPFYACHQSRIDTIGMDIYVEVKVRPVVDANGRIAYYVVTIRDITAERDMYLAEQRHAKEIQRTNDTINNYEQQLRYLLEESKMYVWNYYIEEHRIDFTRTLRGVEHTETLEGYFAGMADDHREQGMEVFRNMVMKGAPFAVVHHFNYTPLSKKSSWYSISGIPVKEKDGSIKKYFGLVRDVTDLMYAQQRLREETQRAEDSGRLKAAFLANMTHEIRTPLNAIVGFSDLLQMVDDSEQRMEMMRIISSNCDMLLRLINDILEASSMGQSLTIQPEEVDLSAVFDEICQTLQQRVQQPGVEFQKDNPYDNYTAIIDKGRLQQLLTNFVTNAVKYTTEGHIKVGYCQQMRNEHGVIVNDGGQDGLYFYCEDTGAGIPKDKQASVFERFVKLNDFVQGTGLGLSICQNIVERCGGRIGVDSEGEGHGSTFWFWVPQV